MERLHNPLTTAAAAAAQPPVEPVKPKEVDTFVASKPPDLIQQVQQEYDVLKARFEQKFGIPMAQLQAQHAEAKADLARFEAVKQMDGDDWCAHLDYAKQKLEKPESLTKEDQIGLKKTLGALEAAPPVYLRHDLVALAATLYMIAQLYYGDPNYKPATPDLQSVQDDAQEAREALQQQEKSQFYELEIRQRLEQTTIALLESTNQHPNFKQSLMALDELEKRLALLKSEKEDRDIILDQAQRSPVTAAYQGHVKKLKSITKETLEKTNEIKKFTQEKNNSALETTQLSLQDKIDLHTERLKALQMEFRKALLDLENCDFEAKVARKCTDPYLSSASLPTPTELVREYQLARHGLSNILDAYKKLFSDLPNFNLDELWNSLSLNTLSEKLIEAKDLARDYPLECAGVVADLAHAYSILTLDGSMIAEAKTILERRTAENMVIDALLGKNKALYSTGKLKEISLEQLALADFCSYAPYIAGVLMKEYMTGAKAAQKAASWIPVWGTWAPVQTAASTAGALKQVQLQKDAARMLSRRYEVIANSILAALRGYKHGGMKGALEEAATYATTRKALQEVGNIFRAAVENRLGKFLPSLKPTTAAAAVKTVTAAGAGTVTAITTFGSAVAAAGGVITTAAVLWPLAAAGSAVIATKLAANQIHEQFKSAETKLLEQQQQMAARLAAARKTIPGLPDLKAADFAAASTEEAAMKVVEAKLQEQQDQECAALAKEANVDPKIIALALEKLSADTKSS